MFRAIKNALRRRQLAVRGIRDEIRIPKSFCGSRHGGWTVHAEAISPGETVYSFGAGCEISFDLSLIAKYGVTVHVFDPTPVSVEWIARQKLPERFLFHACGIAGHDGTAEFYAPQKVTSAHFTPVRRFRDESTATIRAPVKKLRTIMRELGHGEIGLLKLDIEGGEYDVIEDIVRENIPVRQLLVEFHHNYETIPIGRTVDAIAKLRQAGFKIFHISERTYEISLLKSP